MVLLNEVSGHVGLPLTPLLPGEEARICEACGRFVMASPFRGRSGFIRSRSRYLPVCRACRRARSEASPEEQDARIDAWEARERAGEALPVPGARRQGAPGATPSVEMAPFRAWLHDRLADLSLFAAGDPSYPTHKILAKRVGVDHRTLYRWLNGSEEEIEEERIDYALSREGGWMLSDIYPEPTAEPAPTPKRTSAKKKPPACRCASRGCSEHASEGRFCSEHAARLAEIRAGLEADGREMSSHGGAPLAKNKRRRHPQRPTCCNPHCWAEREPGERFCDECAEAGFTEEMYE